MVHKKNVGIDIEAQPEPHVQSTKQPFPLWLKIAGGAVVAGALMYGTAMMTSTMVLHGVKSVPDQSTTVAKSRCVGGQFGFFSSWWPAELQTHVVMIFAMVHEAKPTIEQYCLEKIDVNTEKYSWFKENMTLEIYEGKSNKVRITLVCNGKDTTTSRFGGKLHWSGPKIPSGITEPGLIMLEQLQQP